MKYYKHFNHKLLKLWIISIQLFNNIKVEFFRILANTSYICMSNIARDIVSNSVKKKAKIIAFLYIYIYFLKIRN